MLMTIPYMIGGLSSLWGTVTAGLTDTGSDLSWAMFGILGMAWFFGRHKEDAVDTEESSRAASPAPMPLSSVEAPDKTSELVDQMLSQGRFALLLRPQISSGLDEDHFRRALAALEDSMGLVPDGNVTLEQSARGAGDNPYEGGDGTPVTTRVVSVERLFLDRYPVTNQRFHEFVEAGGYEQMTLWDETIWTAIFDMVDQTGMPGPRYWKDGTYLPGEEDHPVVGVNWYEANAYARWVGKRLPSDAEWVKAGSWPIAVSANTTKQRKYPWGDSMEIERANVWGSATGRICPVDSFSEGVSVGGIYQLVGNVWEWNGGTYRLDADTAKQAVLSTPLKSIRGGAYDTYFENQASCQFQSGEDPLSRRHNIGFRCAIGVCDLSLTQPSARESSSADLSSTEAEPRDDSAFVKSGEVSA